MTFEDFNRWRDRQRDREHRHEVSKAKQAHFLPYLLRVDDSVQLFFSFTRLGVQLTEDRRMAQWWTRPMGGRDEGSVVDLIDVWPAQGRDGRHWLMLTDEPGRMTWLWSPHGWLTQREFREQLQLTYPDWVDVDEGDVEVLACRTRGAVSSAL